VTTAGGSAVNSNDLLQTVQYPNIGGGHGSQQDSYTWNTLGQTSGYTDRNGTTHQYLYDALGRQVSDQVATLGSGVDGSVRRIDTAYDGQGNAYLFTSYDAVTLNPQNPNQDIVNQVQRQYNGLGQLTAEFQSHQAHQAVNTSTTLAVQYGYTDLAGGANNSRMTSLTYPSVLGDSTARVVSYNYTGLDSTISRLSSLSDSGVFLESYLYLGLGTVVERDHPQTGTNLTYISQTGGTGDGGDRYVGLDRFGRVVDQNWYNSNPANAKEEYQYSYDRDGNRLSRQDIQHPGNNETYGYDGLNQLTSFQRGSHSQTWTPDAQGNFTQVRTTDGTVMQTQTRTHNPQNQILTVNGAGLDYDNNGNLIQDSSTSPASVYAYDAWNRLISATTPNGSVSYQYDALGRRIVETRAATTDLYYSDQWQVLEERTGGMSPTRLQYVWSPVYVDAVVARDSRDPSTGALLQRLYAVQDANWNVTAVLNTSSQEVERYVYDPYGAVTVTALIGPSPNWAYLFQGGRLDSTTGLYYFRNRDESPVLMRWTRQDPLSFAAGDTNLDRYVQNNPTNAIDPSGLGSYIPRPPSKPWPGGTLVILPGIDKPHEAGDFFQQSYTGWWHDTAYHFFGGGCRPEKCKNLNDVKKLLESVPDGSITTLVIGGHGSRTGIRLDPNADLNTVLPGNVVPSNSTNFNTVTICSVRPDIPRLIRRKLAKDGRIEIYSCGAGDELAQQIWANLTGATVVAYNGTCPGSWVKLTDENSITVRPDNRDPMQLYKDWLGTPPPTVIKK
jgi:RHS repeat-associated protein